jgi:co-chaperonin GroES (HSP10)
VSSENPAEDFSIDPFRGRIIVQIDKFKYTGRIVIPDNAKRSPTTGVVKWVGEGVTQCEPGQTVIFGLYSGTALKFKGQPYYRVLTEDEIFGKKRGEAELEDETA